MLIQALGIAVFKQEQQNSKDLKSEDSLKNENNLKKEDELKT